MRISTRGAREVGNIKRDSALEARDFDNMNSSIAGANEEQEQHNRMGQAGC